MRILVATTHTLPAFSGGWTTPLDLFGEDHQAMYVIRNYPAVVRTIENITVAGVGVTAPFRKTWGRLERYRHAILNKLFRRTLNHWFRKFGADFVMCLDPGAGYAAMQAGLPYSMRFHSKIRPEHKGDGFEELLSRSLFNISGPTTGAQGITEIPHNQDLSRFVYSEPVCAERAVLLTSIDEVHIPELFLEGIMLSKGMRGDIVGTGPLREKMRKLCRATEGRVRCLDPVPRLQVPATLGRYQIGVATVEKISSVVYQMKVNAYMASGLYTLAMPWTHIAHEAPELIGEFTTAGELAEHFDYLQKNWPATLQARRQAKEWINEKYSVEIPRKMFNRILRETFAGTS